MIRPAIQVLVPFLVEADLLLIFSNLYPTTSAIMDRHGWLLDHRSPWSSIIWLKSAIPSASHFRRSACSQNLMNRCAWHRVLALCKKVPFARTSERASRNSQEISWQNFSLEILVFSSIHKSIDIFKLVIPTTTKLPISFQGTKTLLCCRNWDSPLIFTLLIGSICSISRNIPSGISHKKVQKTL